MHPFNRRILAEDLVRVRRPDQRERYAAAQRQALIDPNPREIVRQQWNFSPAGSTSELEDYEVNLEGVSALELEIKPDLTHNEAWATLAAWRMT